MLKKSLLWLTATVFSLYTTVVLQSLWKWIVVPAFNISLVSIWVMYGLVLLVGLFTEQRDEFVSEQRWKAFAIVLEKCVPPDQKEAAENALDVQIAENVWREAGKKIFAISNTVTLIMGWFVHAILV